MQWISYLRRVWCGPAGRNERYSSSVMRKDKESGFGFSSCMPADGSSVSPEAPLALWRVWFITSYHSYKVIRPTLSTSQMRECGDTYASLQFVGNDQSEEGV